MSVHFSSELFPFPLSPQPSTEALREDEREELILSHMEDVKQVARSILRRLPGSVQLDDLIQAGSIGLLDAARRFGPGHKLAFRQYARIRISGAIFDSLRDLDWASRHFRTRQQKLDETTRSLASKLGRNPDSNEVADAMGMDLNAFFEFAQAMRNRQQVDFEPREDAESRSALETVADDAEKRPDAMCHQNESRGFLRKLVAQLPPDEAKVVILYYFKEWTMLRIAKSIGKTESRVCQIHRKAVENLRDQLGPGARQLMTRHL